MFRGGGRFDGEGGGGYVVEEPLEEHPRRQIIVRLSDLKSGLTTLKPVVSADAQQKFDTIIAAINPVIDAAANKDIVNLNVARAVVDMANAIKAVAGTAAPTAAPAEEDGFDQPPKPAPRAPAAPAGDAPAAKAPAEAAPAAAARAGAQ